MNMFLKYFLTLNVMSIFAPEEMPSSEAKVVGKVEKTINTWNQLTRKTFPTHYLIMKDDAIRMVTRKTGKEVLIIYVKGHNGLVVESDNEASKALFPTDDIESAFLVSINNKDLLKLTFINDYYLLTPVFKNIEDIKA